ncbi:M1 family metallopeptidase [Hyunsoonleella aestuarii]|uniref:Aminopeptidase N n=1 Tax=Hyunsoonleella aestuarii TaxID=912802 RepID=A0ABP8ED36_9FLAO|nr:M1 family metallopeptidase [Hyunsoonleella aestuarii]
MKVLLKLSFFIHAALCLAQQTDYVDFKSVNAIIEIKPKSNQVTGEITLSFDILKTTDSIFIDAQNMQLENVRFNNDSINWSNDGKKLWLIKSFKPSHNNEISFRYNANPTKSIYFIDWEDDVINSGQIWTQGQGKYTSNWLPSIDDMNDKIEFDLSVTFDKDYEVIANGNLTFKQFNDSTITWHYDMQKPMSSYLVALAIGKYNKKVAYSKRGIPLEMYYYPEDSLKFEPTYRYTKAMFDFLENEIGVPYPWQNYKQVPVKDFLYAGMENTSLTIFSDSFVVDSIGFVDKNYVNVNAHELAHQWFGNLVTETSGMHHWLHEGFATYYALLAEKDIFGENYYYWKLYEYAQELLDQDRAGQSTSLLDPKSSSITFYKKGAWVLHILRESIKDKAFRTAVTNYLIKQQFKNIETNDFIGEVEKVIGKDLNELVERWLIKKEFPYDEAMQSLKKSTFIQEFLMVDCEVQTSKCKKYLSSPISAEAKSKIIRQNDGLITVETFRNPLKVRQTISKSLSKVPLELKENYETLLDDKSYITLEAALFGLWNSFPDEQGKYLNKTKGLVGFSDKNIKTLWLTLALLTDDFEPENDNEYFSELTDFTSSKYSFEVRQNAFRYLAWVSSCGIECQENLKEATKHHNWRFSKFAKELLKKIE